MPRGTPNAEYALPAVCEFLMTVGRRRTILARFTHTLPLQRIAAHGNHREFRSVLRLDFAHFYL